MSDVTNEHLDLLERALVAIENDYRPTCIPSNYGNGCAGATAESTEFWRRAADCTQAMITEIRSRRAQDPTAGEVEALKWLRSWAEPRLDLSSDKDASCDHCVIGAQALAALSKLLQAGEGKR